MGIHEDPFVKDFTVIVQFGAILSVIVAYRERLQHALKSGPTPWLKLGVGFLPAGVIGFLLKDHVDAWLGSVEVVGWSLLLGGVLLIFADRLWGKGKAQDALHLPYAKVVAIGLTQCLALVPGVSRSGASIIGGMALGLSRSTAADFSFFLALPTLGAATLYKSMKIAPTITEDQILPLLLGNLVSFIVGLLAIRMFIRFIAQRGFFWFGVYRILVGSAILLILASGYTLKMQ
jgi:undecaprenyl-diphosphatase